MNGYQNMLEQKLSLLEKSFREDGVFDNSAGNVESLCAAFVSVCDTNERAFVFRAAENTPEQAWKSACEKSAEFVRRYDYAPVWVKADVMASRERIPFEELQNRIAASRNEFFRRGIAFDDRMESALIETEINGNRVISYKKHMLELPVLNEYLAECGLPTLSGFPEEVTLFDCESRFCDDSCAVFPLYGSGSRCGRRIIGEFTDSTALEVITTSAEYLSMQVRMDGRFEYGCYPIDHLEIPGYNILRHSSAIWSLICAYRLTGERFTLNQIIKAVGYMVGNTYRKYPGRDGRENVVFLADKTRSEIKVGGNALAVIMLTEFMSATGSDKYTKLCRELGNGILEMFDQGDGSFWHVLEFPTLQRKEKFRTVYYDGEAVFALCRLYGLTGERKWLDAAAVAADRFIREGYEKYRDHWVAYSMNELTKHLPEDRYLSFGLKNANVNLRRIRGQDTTYHTYLELLCVTFEMYSRITEQGLECSYLPEFRAEELVDTIFYRAEYMLNGYGYPEYVMYLKYPSAVLGAFFVRHDGYRIRIDDIQHFCSAYYSFYRNYGRLAALRESFGQEREVGENGS